jgi:hypothetical protein
MSTKPSPSSVPNIIVRGAASGQSLRVCNGGSIMAPDAARTVLPPGTVLKPGFLAGIKPSVIEEWKRLGVVEVARDTAEEERTGDIKDAQQLPIRTAPEGGALDQKEILRVGGAENSPAAVAVHGEALVSAANDLGVELPGSKIVAPQAAPTDVQQGKWNLDPATLQGKTIDQLNTLIAGIDASVEPFDAVEIEDAIAFLSQNFGK